MKGERTLTGTSTRDTRDRVGPLRRRTVWSCTAARGVLFRRYYLLETAWLGLYVHHLVASDDDRALHDHPWAFVTCLIGGGYFEHTFWGRRWHPRFSVLVRPARFAHRLELVKPTWTLVLRFRRGRLWGFYGPGGWLDWKAYGRLWCD